MSDSTITPASPVKIAEAAVSSAVSTDASIVRAEAEKAVAIARASAGKIETSISTAVKADVGKLEALWIRFKPYAPGFLIGWFLGWVSGAVGFHGLHL